MRRGESGWFILFFSSCILFHADEEGRKARQGTWSCLLHASLANERIIEHLISLAFLSIKTEREREKESLVLEVLRYDPSSVLCDCD